MKTCSNVSALGLRHRTLAPTLTGVAALTLMMALMTMGCEGEAEVDARRTEPAQPVAAGEQETAQPAADGQRRDAAQPTASNRPPKVAEGRKEGDNIHYSFAYPTGDRASSALLVEKVGPAQVRIGQPYKYQIEVTNLTDQMLAGVTIVESLGEGFEFGSSTPSPSHSETGISRWMIGEVHPKQTQVIEATTIANRAGKLTACLAASFEPTLCTQIEVVEPQLKVTKEQVGLTKIQTETEASQQIAYLCDQITYKYTVSNTGSGEAKNVVVQDDLPEGLQTADGKDSVAFQAGDLAAGDSKSFEVQIQPQQEGDFSSRAVAKSASDEAHSNNVTTPVREPVVEVRVNGPEWQYVNQPVTYTVRVRNPSEVPARDVVLTLQAPGLDEKQSNRQIGELPPGQEKTLNVTLRPNEGGDIKVIATATGHCVKAGGEEFAAITAIRTIPALVLEMVDNKDPVQVGETTVYTIGVKNQGSGAAKNVTMTATLPEGFEFVESGGQTEIKREGNKLNFAPVAELPPGEIANWWVEAKASQAGDVRFQINLNSEYLDKPVPEVEPTRAIETQATAR